MTEENKDIETENTADNKKRKIAGLKQRLQSIFGASMQRTLQAGFTINVRRSLTYILAFILIFVFYIFCINDISFAGEVSKFNYKDSNPAPGLYRIDSMHQPRYNHQAVALDNETILITGSKNIAMGDGSKKAEVFDFKTGKFREVQMLYYHNLNGHNSISIGNGKVLVSCGLDADKHQYRYEIYDAKTKKFYPGPKTNLFCEHGVFLRKKENGNIMAYGTTRKIGSYSDEPASEEYNIEENSISKFSKFDSNAFFTGDENKLCKNYKMSNYKETFNLIFSKGGYNICYADNKSIVVAAGEVDYDIKTADIENGRYKSSWFSPLYYADYERIKLTKMNEYLHSFEPNIVKIKNKNMFLITGGLVPIYNLSKPYDAPNNIPLNQRILYTAPYAVKYAYILVY